MQRDDEVGIVEGRAVRVGQRVAELSPFVDRPGRLGRDVRGDTAGDRELPEQSAQSLGVPSDGLSTMDDPRSEHARREAEGWSAFEDALSRVPDERLTAPGVLEGWR